MPDRQWDQGRGTQGRPRAERDGLLSAGHHPLTHSHHDHAQGIPVLREARLKSTKTSRYSHPERPFRSWQTHPISKSWGRDYASITDVAPLDEGDAVDLGSTTLRIYSVPGHIKDHIAILDERTGNIFVGDAIGAQFGERASVPVFFAPFWDTEAFYASVDKLRQIDYQTLCLAHFGPVRGAEAKTILDKAIATYAQWWRVLEEHPDRLDDTGYLWNEILAQTQFALPQIETVSPSLRLVLGLVTVWNKLIHGPSWSTSKLFLPDTVESLVKGYRTYKGL